MGRITPNFGGRLEGLGVGECGVNVGLAMPKWGKCTAFSLHSSNNQCWVTWVVRTTRALGLFNQ